MGRGVGDQRLRGRLRRRLLLLRPCGRGRNTRRPPVAVALAAVRGALSECRLVVAGVPILSALAGARAGTVGITLSTKKTKG
jgi:hypothetical protein